MRCIWLGIASILSLVACGDSKAPPETPQASLPPPATATSSLLLTSTDTPVVAPTAPPTAVPNPLESFFSIRQYATTCGKLVVLQDETYEQFRSVNKVGSQEHWDWYVEWVDRILALRPPPELADFHEARAGFYLSEVEHEGPNSQTRAAFLRELAVADAMPDDLREILLESGCLDEGRLSVGRSNLEVIERVAARGPAPDPPTVEDYADRCNDVWLAVPLFDSHDAYLEHYFTGMDSLVPPPELQEFHRHLVGKLRRMFAEKDDPRLSTEIARLATRHSESLSPELHRSLVVAGCIARDAPAPQSVTSTPAPVTSPSSATGQTATATPEPTATHPLVPTSTATPRPTISPTPEPTATAIPIVLLALEVDSSVAGYWSDGSADVTLDIMLVNRGDLPSETVQNVRLTCGQDSEVLQGCNQEAALNLADGFGPETGSFDLRLPMGTMETVSLDYGGHEPFVLEVEAPARILGLERDLFDCYADRESPPDSDDQFLYGCFGSGDKNVAKWLNDTPVKVWAIGDASYIEDFRNVLTGLSPILGLDFTWVDSEHEADLRGYIGVHREDIDQLGFSPSTVDYGGFANASMVAGRGYVRLSRGLVQRRDSADQHNSP